jgi:hypothetical protein
MGALFYHAEEGKPMSSRLGGRFQTIGKFMVEGWLWLEEFGCAGFYEDVGEFLKRYHGTSDVVRGHSNSVHIACSVVDR